MINTVYNFLQGNQSFLFLKNLIDILIIAAAIYTLLVFVKQTHFFSMLWGLAVLILVIVFSKVLNLGLTSRVIESLWPSFTLIFVIVFQKEVRYFFEWLFHLSRRQDVGRISPSSKISEIIVKAAENLAAKKVGALIVITGNFRLEGIIEGGWPLNGQISMPLILSIFDPSSPGHDGAIVIEGDVVKKFGVHLPLAENFQAFGNLGTRHRAALGLAQKSDAMVIVVSEERGTISLAYKGNIKVVENISELQKQIEKFVKEKFPSKTIPLKNIFIRNLKEKVLSIVIALILWILLIY
jgi:diadenylate cyclase